MGAGNGVGGGGVCVAVTDVSIELYVKSPDVTKNP